MANKFTEQDYKNRINLLFPDWQFSILTFDGMKKPATVKCENCGAILNFSKASDICRKINVCTCYNYFKNYHEKLNYLSAICNFSILDDSINTTIKTIQCTNCGTVMRRQLMSILMAPEHCDNCHKYRQGVPQISKQEAQEKLNLEGNNEYELLDYIGMQKPAKLRHKNCGFIFNIRNLGDLFNKRNRGCPKCYQFKSKGEQEILAFLEKHNIQYIPQKTFAPLNKSKYRFDFYLPQFNIAIEYQGEQHYRDNNFFKDNLNIVQQRDAVKRQYCLENNIELLEIPYWEYKNISQILASRFNDYLS